MQSTFQKCEENTNKLLSIIDNDQRNVEEFEETLQSLASKIQKTKLQVTQEWNVQNLYVEVFKMSYKRKLTGLEEELNPDKGGDIVPNFDNAIWWYSCDKASIYYQINSILRIENFELLMNYRYYISDLCQMIETMFLNNAKKDHKPLTLYRADKISKSSFEQMKQTQGLITMNGFISTTTDEKISAGYAKNQFVPKGAISVLFEIQFDPETACTAFANIEKIAFHPEEQETLFSMGSVFSVDKIEEPVGDENYYRIKLLASDLDKSVVDEMRLKVEKCSQSGLCMLLARYLVELGEYRAVKRYLNSLLETGILNNDPSIASAYNCLGMIYARQGLYGDALHYYKQALSHQARLDYANNNALGEIYNNIGNAYMNLSYLDEALQVFNEAERTLLREPLSTRQHFATLQCNIGYVHYLKKDYDIAENFFHSAYILSDTQVKLLSDTVERHLTAGDIIIKYADNCFAREKHFNASESLYNNAIHIYEKILPSLNSTLIKAYTAGFIEYGKEKWFTAVMERYKDKSQTLLSKYELTITADLQYLTQIQYLIGICYIYLTSNPNSANFDSAIHMWKQAYICEKKQYIGKLLRTTAMSLKNYCPTELLHKAVCKIFEYYKNEHQISNQMQYNFELGLLCTISFRYEEAKRYLEFTFNDDNNNYIYSIILADVYNHLQDYNMAIVHYEKTLKFIKTENDPLLIAEIYLTIANCYNNLNRSTDKALHKLHELEKYLQTQDVDNKIIAIKAALNHELARQYLKCAKYDKAHLMAKESRAFKLQSFSQHHPSIVIDHILIGDIYAEEQNYKQAIECYKKALDIQISNFSMEHQDIKKTYKIIGDVYCKMGKYNEAIESYELWYKIKGEDEFSLAKVDMYNAHIMSCKPRVTSQALANAEMAAETWCAQIPLEIMETAKRNFMKEELANLLAVRYFTSNMLFVSFLEDLLYIYLKYGYAYFKSSSIKSDIEHECKRSYEKALSLQLKLIIYQNSNEHITDSIYETIGFISEIFNNKQDALDNYKNARNPDKDDRRHVIFWKIASLSRSNMIAETYYNRMKKYVTRVYDTQNIIMNTKKISSGETIEEDQNETGESDTFKSDNNKEKNSFFTKSLATAVTYYLLHDYQLALKFFRKDIEERSKNLSYTASLSVNWNIKNSSTWPYLLELITKRIWHIKQSKIDDSLTKMDYKILADIYVKCAEILLQINDYSTAFANYLNAFQLYIISYGQSKYKIQELFDKLSSSENLSLNDIIKYYADLLDDIDSTDENSSQYNIWIELKKACMTTELAENGDKNRLFYDLLDYKQYLSLDKHFDLMIDATFNYIIITLFDAYNDDHTKYIEELKIDDNLPLVDRIVLYRSIISLMKFASKRDVYAEKYTEIERRYRQMLHQALSKAATTPIIAENNRKCQTLTFDDIIDIDAHQTLLKIIRRDASDPSVTATLLLENDNKSLSSIGGILSNVGAYNIAVNYWQIVCKEKENILSMPIISSIHFPSTNLNQIYNKIKLSEAKLFDNLITVANMYYQVRDCYEMHSQTIILRDISGKFRELAAMRHARAVEFHKIADTMFNNLMDAKQIMDKIDPLMKKNYAQSPEDSENKTDEFSHHF
ncbi:unnamed protein product [Didymodactylos carnosus]|uniref:Uncharacterized protein n=1 Tax=Didymodactylos carnosus TaxID=1234261 RepID=A0A814TBW9_9BILA|nr:unnamed protein product [Didymodactylos carnosus]CAF1159376.1 unnamed protein product [Didymodactylos carnosus]CAF3791961.1 unnamed protein product [Didymodactylos carnosus]CAF3922836.1 unnamed protein product [Didymodactylos carnosus]